MKILVLDDDTALLKALKTILVMNDHDVDCSDNAKEAVGKVAVNEYDFILVDYKMPENDGIWFMENAVSPWLAPAIKEGSLAVALPGETLLQQVSVGNIGAAAAVAIDQGERFHGQRHDLAGDELSGETMREIIQTVVGKKISYQEIPVDAILEQNEDMGKMFRWFEETGYEADIDGLRSVFPEVDWVTFDEWARHADWSAVQ